MLMNMSSIAASGAIRNAIAAWQRGARAAAIVEVKRSREWQGRRHDHVLDIERVVAAVTRHRRLESMADTRVFSDPVERGHHGDGLGTFRELFLRSDILFGILRVWLHPRRRIALGTCRRGTAGCRIGWASGTLWLGLGRHGLASGLTGI